MSNLLGGREMELQDIDLADAEVHSSGLAIELFRILRDRAPVHWNESRGVWAGFWSITRYEDVQKISRDPKTFSSEQDFKLIPAGAPEESMLYNGMGPTLLNMDPPRHVRVRRLMTSAFTPTFVRAREPEIRQIVQHTLNDVCEKGSCDFVVDIAAKIPIAVICEKLGVPRPDWLRMFELTNDIVGEHGDPSDGPRQISALQELLSYFTNMIAEIRRAGASDALISRLAFAQVDGDHLSDEEILWLCATLLLAGNESTRNAMAGGLEALNAHIDQLQLLIDQPWRVSTAVDEMIRWVSPIGHMTRVATHDTEVRGTRIRNGERICMWYLSANRDEEKFERADELDISRDPNPHLGFGTGEHFCLGASFAKLEMRVLFESLIERFPDMALEGSPSRLMSNSFNGYRHMPVTFAPQSPVN